MRRIFTAVFAAAAAAGCLAYAGQEAVKEEKPVVDFTLPQLDGKPFVLGENLGKGYVVINFWARWCTSCEEEVPELAALKKLPGADKALFIGMNVGDSQAKAAKFAARFKYPYLVVLDKDKAVTKKYGVLGLPVTMIISRDRKVVYRGSRPPRTFDFTK